MAFSTLDGFVLNELRITETGSLDESAGIISVYQDAGATQLVGTILDATNRNETLFRAVPAGYTAILTNVTVSNLGSGDYVLPTVLPGLGSSPPTMDALTYDLPFILADGSYDMAHPVGSEYGFGISGGNISGGGTTNTISTSMTYLLIKDA